MERKPGFMALSRGFCPHVRPARVRSCALLTAGLAIGVASPSSQAAMVVDLTTAGAQGTINGAIYQQTLTQPTGTGNIDSFAQIQPQGNNSTSQGYNTTVNNTLDNGSSDNFNHAITLGEIPLVDIMSVTYRQLLLDINESDGGPSNDRFLSLDEIQVFVGGTPNSSVETFTGGILDHDGTLVYRMDQGMDNWVALDFQLGSGSGSGDMFLYLPNSLFDAYTASDTVTLYSEFGQQGVDPVGVPAGDYGASAGFEEWAVLIPEPASGALVLATLGALSCARRRTSLA